MKGSASGFLWIFKMQNTTNNASANDLVLGSNWEITIFPFVSFRIFLEFDPSSG